MWLSHLMQLQKEYHVTLDVLHYNYSNRDYDNLKSIFMCYKVPKHKFILAALIVLK